MRCSKCGTNNPSADNFCAKCGSSLAKFCARCKAENPPTSDFCGKCGTRLTNDADAAAATSPPRESASNVRVAPENSSPQTLEGERKMVTALFADIKGSTELEQDLDPEEARAIIDPALKLMIDAARRYDGYIVQSTGDGIFALFGAPVAHEDHPQRSLYAALRMQEEIRRYSDRLRTDGRAPIQIRVGVNTGEVGVSASPTGGGHRANRHGACFDRSIRRSGREKAGALRRIRSPSNQGRADSATGQGRVRSRTEPYESDRGSQDAARKVVGAARNHQPRTSAA